MGFVVKCDYILFPPVLSCQ